MQLITIRLVAINVNDAIYADSVMCDSDTSADFQKGRRGECVCTVRWTRWFNDNMLHTDMLVDCAHPFPSFYTLLNACQLYPYITFKNV